MQLIYIILISCGLAASLHEKEIEQEWWKFKQNYGKTYRNLVEYNRRYKNFKENLKLISKHNLLYENGKTTYKMGINAYSDKDFKEMESSYMGSKIDESFLDYNFDAEIFKPSLSVRILPKSLDWRSLGAVTKVKNQGSCGSCWAFSAIGAMESHYFLKTKNLTLLSEQNLVDCDTQSFGCSGGYKHLAFNYIRDNGGINTEESYPYVAKQQNCTFKRENIGATCRGYIRLPSGNETSLLEAIATKGPIAVSIEVTRNFQNYKTGVFNDTTCGNRTNHGVLLVGYGSVNGSDYWLVKNSWGTSWGEQGYIKMSRNKNNQCFIASYGFYPLV